VVVVVVVVVVPAPGDPIDQTRRPDVNLPRSAPHRLIARRPRTRRGGGVGRSVAPSAGRCARLTPRDAHRTAQHSTKQYTPDTPLIHTQYTPNTPLIPH